MKNNDIKNFDKRNIFVQGCCIMDGTGVNQGLDWLISQI